MAPSEFPQWFKKRFHHTSSFAIGLVFMVFDCVGIMLCFGAGFFTVNAVDHTLIVFRDFVNYWVYLPAFATVFFAARLYPGIMMQPAEEVRKFSLSSFFCFTGIAISIAVETDDRTALSIAFLLAVPFATVLLPLLREGIRAICSSYSWWGVPVVIYSCNANRYSIADRLLHKPSLAYRPAVIINTEARNYEEYKGIPVFPFSQEIEGYIHACNITTAIVMEMPEGNTANTPLDSILSGYRYIIAVPYYQNLKVTSLTVRDFGDIFGFSASNRLTRPINLLIKRCIDLSLLLCASPFFILLTVLIAILVKCTSKGPIFYGHKRIGKNNKMITVWKFRSMVMNADEILKELLKTNPELKREWEDQRKLKNDPRITPVGAFLRKTSLDELPQLLNILCGQMSFVGPRPVTEAERGKYGKAFQYVFSVTPGLSGMWQTSGRSSREYTDRILLDTFYIQNWSIWLDIWILLKTCIVVIKGKGAY